MLGSSTEESEVRDPWVTQMRSLPTTVVSSTLTGPLNWALMATGLIDRVQVTVLPVITGATGADPVFGGAADFDLELLESRTLDGRTLELTYRPSRH